MAKLTPGTQGIFAAETTQQPESELPGRTWWINPATNRLEGFVDGRQAIAQAIEKALATERFVYPIYSWNYGAEINNLIGEPFSIVEAELPRIVQEAVLADERVLEVKQLTVTRQSRSSVFVTFTAVTQYGEIPTEKAVKLSV